MAVAPPLGCRMKTSQLAGQASPPTPPKQLPGWRRRCRLRCLVLLLLGALAAPAATFYVTISGLGGEPDYDQRFKMWAQDIDSSLKKAGTPDPNVVTLIAPTREQIRTHLASLASTVKATDNLVVVLIGHGTFDGVDYKFNVQGPDLTGAKLSTLLDRVPSARQLVVVTTTSSGATIFARDWADTLREPSADVDKNESVSALEAFRYAQRKTKEFFDTQKRLATEHSVFEDTGKGTGVAAAAAPDAAADSNAAEGRLAASFTVVRLGANTAASKDPAKKALLEKKEGL